MSRNENELTSASLFYMGAANLPEMLKPAIVGQVTLESSRRALRGDWRQRIGKEKHRNLGDPARVRTPRRKSDGFIVAMKDLTNLERREPTVSAQPSKQHATA